MSKNKRPPFIGTRKIVEIGGSLYINIPKQFIEGNRVKAGDEVLVMANRDMLVSKMNVSKLTKAHKKVEELIKG